MNAESRVLKHLKLFLWPQDEFRLPFSAPKETVLKRIEKAIAAPLDVFGSDFIRPFGGEVSDNGFRITVRSNGTTDYGSSLSGKVVDTDSGSEMFVVVSGPLPFIFIGHSAALSGFGFTLFLLSTAQLQAAGILALIIAVYAFGVWGTVHSFYSACDVAKQKLIYTCTGL